MAKYRKKGQIDVYEKEKEGCLGPVIGIIVVIVIIAICAGAFSDDADGSENNEQPEQQDSTVIVPV